LAHTDETRRSSECQLLGGRADMVEVRQIDADDAQRSDAP